MLEYKGRSTMVENCCTRLKCHDEAEHSAYSLTVYGAAGRISQYRESFIIINLDFLRKRLLNTGERT